MADRDARDYYGASALLVSITRSGVSRHLTVGRQTPSSSHVHAMNLRRIDVGPCQAPLVRLHLRTVVRRLLP